MKLVELLIVMTAANAPYWIMATKLNDLSELAAAGMGASVVAVYKIWTATRHKPEDKPE